MDIVSSAKRKEMMSGIRGKNTRPELLVRSSLHRMGFRYRLHAKELSGKPDLVFAQHRAVIFVNGCFWHGHQCNLFKWPKTRPVFWRAKITGNTERDRRNHSQLEADGWRIGIVWECALKGARRQNSDEVFHEIARWLKSSIRRVELTERAGD